MVVATPPLHTVPKAEQAAVVSCPDPKAALNPTQENQPHPDADFKIDDVEVQQLTFVGQIRNISTQTTNITYKLDDGTGSVEVKQWIDAEANNTSLDIGDSNPHGGRGGQKDLVENEWARVWGRLKAFNNRRHVGAHVIRPVKDKMEIQYHLLEATYVHLFITRGPLDDAAGGKGGANGPEADDGGQYGDNGGRNMPSVSPNARRVYQCLKESPQNNEGLHVQNIAASLRMQVADIMKAGDELLTQSMIFTTVDDNTWALLEF
ncbi:MAG: hypothetical protein Q9218_001504 [Villophora microphyllina]